MEHRKLSFFIAGLSLIGWTATSQVTIGTLDNPHEGAVLHLRSSSLINKDTLGLKLSVVALPDTSTLHLAGFEDETDESATGMWIYNITDDPCEGLIPCLYVWDGGKWVPSGCSPFCENTNTISINGAQSATIEEGSTPTVTGSLPSGGDCNGNYLYEWQISTGCDGTWTTISGAAGQHYVLPATLTQGNYCYRRIVYCANRNTTSNTVTVTVVERSDVLQCATFDLDYNEKMLKAGKNLDGQTIKIIIDNPHHVGLTAATKVKIIAENTAMGIRFMTSDTILNDAPATTALVLYADPSFSPANPAAHQQDIPLTWRCVNSSDGSDNTDFFAGITPTCGVATVEKYGRITVIVADNTGEGRQAWGKPGGTGTRSNALWDTDYNFGPHKTVDVDEFGPYIGLDFNINVGGTVAGTRPEAIQIQYAVNGYSYNMSTGVATYRGETPDIIIHSRENIGNPASDTDAQKLLGAYRKHVIENGGWLIYTLRDYGGGGAQSGATHTGYLFDSLGVTGVTMTQMASNSTASNQLTGAVFPLYNWHSSTFYNASYPPYYSDHEPILEGAFGNLLETSGNLAAQLHKGTSQSLVGNTTAAMTKTPGWVITSSPTATGANNSNGFGTDYAENSNVNTIFTFSDPTGIHPLVLAHNGSSFSGPSNSYLAFWVKKPGWKGGLIVLGVGQKSSENLTDGTKWPALYLNNLPTAIYYSNANNANADDGLIVNSLLEMNSIAFAVEMIVACDKDDSNPAGF